MDDLTPGEEWRQVPGYEGLYEVSDQGRVKSLPRLTRAGMRGGKILKLSSDLDGYRGVSLSRNGIIQRYKVATLVAAAFLGPRPENEVVRHLDGIRDHDTPKNLAYGTKSEDIYDQVRIGTHANSRKMCCSQGHEFTPENTRYSLNPDGTIRHRICRTCARQWSLEARQRIASSGVCSEKNCGQPRFGCGLCMKHYSRLRRNGRA